ncbi:MAG: hypothetical protein COA78_02415 [Blastopirellula sp.]|nr:MAG: hypothetical protein COA78_02415 [Blastopirellula sp.]
MAGWVHVLQLETSNPIILIGETKLNRPIKSRKPGLLDLYRAKCRNRQYRFLFFGSEFQS